MSHKTSGQVACYENQMIDGEALLMEELRLEGTRVSETALLQLWLTVKKHHQWLINLLRERLMRNFIMGDQNRPALFYWN